MTTAARVEYLFITADGIFNLDGHVTAYSASARLGTLVPARALTRLGYDARACSVASGPAGVEEAVRSAKRVVFGDLLDTSQGWGPTIATYRSLLALLSEPRSRVVFNISDDRFADAQIRGFYEAALPDCLAVTTISEPFAQALAKRTSRPVKVAPEPYEGVRGRPLAFAARRAPGLLGWLARRIGVSQDLWRLRILWFGYPMNLPALFELLPQLEAFAAKRPLLLTCVTNPAPELMALMTPQRTSEASALRLRFVQWTPLVLDSELAAADVVLIPSDYRNPVKQAKSANRLVAGLHGGRFVVAHPLPAYRPYADFAWVGEDLCAGLAWALAHPREVVERIARGQSFIDEKHSPEAIARFWLDVFDARP